MAFNIDIGFATQAGRKDNNEDFCAAMLPDPGQEGMGSIVAIADGVSTGGMGKEAAQTTVTSLVRDYYGTPETWDTSVALDRIISAQNTWLAGINRRRQPVMGLTTLTALVLRGQSYTLAHVGDSRAYLLRGGETVQLTHDHAVNHPDFSHKLLRSVGAEDHVVVDYMQGELHVGDVFVLVTDGVHGVIRESRLKEFAGLRTEQSAQLASQGLVDAALAAGSNDNVTAVVVRVLGLLEATLQDTGHLAQSLPIPARLKVGEVIDGLRVTATVADNGINVLYQVRAIEPAPGGAPAAGKLYALKTLNPARAHDNRNDPCWRTRPGWPGACRRAGRLIIWSGFTSVCPRTPSAAPFTCCMTGTLVKPCNSSSTAVTGSACSKRSPLPRRLRRRSDFCTVSAWFTATSSPPICIRAKTACCACSTWGWR